jgi:pyrroline-5-carboxylate reductase
MNSNDENDNGISPLREAAISLNVMYEELRRAGFSRRDALELVSKVMIGSIGEMMEENKHPDDL